VQDEIILIDKRLRLTLGTKLELNDYTGLEVQPSGHLLWTPHPQHTLWAAASRAVSTPSVIDRTSRINNPVFRDQNGPLTVISILGNTQLSSEELLA
jgi:iron complex outermembrane receptor protein